MFRSLVYDQIREDTLYILLYAAVTMVCADGRHAEPNSSLLRK